MSVHRLLAIGLVIAVPLLFVVIALADSGANTQNHTASQGNLIESSGMIPIVPPQIKSSRATVLVMSMTVFVLAVFIGFEVIAKVPPTLHTPLMSGSNAISGITVVGAILCAGYKQLDLATWLGFVAVVLANINAVGGFVVTHRMLNMFKKR